MYKLTLLLGLFILFLAEGKKQPVIKLTNIEKCEATADNSIPWEIELNNADSNGHKVIDAEFDLRNLQFSKEVSYTLDVDKFNNGDWEKNVFNHEGNLCDLIKKYVSKAWQKMLDMIEPRPVGICDAQQAVFKLKQFEVLKTEVQIPPIYGKIQTTLNLFDKSDANILCMMIEVEIADE